MAGDVEMAATEKQKKFAGMIAQTLGEEIPVECYEDFNEMRSWIDSHINMVEKDEDGNLIFKPSDKQTSFAEMIAKRLNLSVPSGCYTNGRKMSAWIDEHVEEYHAKAPKRNNNSSDDML